MKKRKHIFLLPEINVKELAKIVAAITGVIILVYFTPQFIQTWRLKKLDAQTTGVIVSVEKQEGVQETQAGSKIVTRGYHINYRYKIDEKSFNKYQYILVKSLTIKQSMKFKSLKAGDTVLIKFDAEKPENSMIYPD